MSPGSFFNIGFLYYLNISSDVQMLTHLLDSGLDLVSNNMI